VWNRTYYPKAADHENVKKQWYIVDATDKRLGRLASTVAIHIRGKNMPTYTPSTDMGAYVIIVCFYSVTIALVLFYNTQLVDIVNRFCQSFSI
jgi:large subunit ribosomal protein L13